MTASLAERLKSETRGLHVEAERSVFMRALLRGRLPREPYCSLLCNLHALYGALEAALDMHAAHPVLANVCNDALRRHASIVHDLEALQGPAWAASLAVQPAMRRYVQRLALLAQRHPERLVAHAYVRYLGDLSGGQMLARIVEASLQLPPGRGTRFYDFGGAAAVHEHVAAFRRGLAALPADPALDDALVAEAQLAFRLHHQLFDELAACHGLIGPVAFSPTP